MATDFRSLLSTFQAATGGEENGDDPKSTKEDPKNLSLKELTDKMWRVTQIKQSSVTGSKTKQNHPSSSCSNIRLAICLCIVDQFPHEVVWKRWMMQDSNTDSAAEQTQRPTAGELYIHAKHPERVSSSWTRSKLIPISHCPNWNDVRIVKAMLSLMEEALKDERVTHIVFGTESCIPICPLEEIGSSSNGSIQPNRSYVAYYGRDSCTRFDERHCWDIVQKDVPSDAIYKALPGWCALCRQHAQAILGLPKTHLAGHDLWPAFTDCWAPEEVFFPTCLALLGVLLDKEEVSQRSLTYSEWNERARNPKDRAHPLCWDDEFDQRLVRELRDRHGCLFLRKVKRTVPLYRWEQAVVYQHHEGIKRKRPNHDLHQEGRSHDTRRHR